MSAPQPALIPTRPITCLVTKSLTEAATYTAELRAKLVTWPGRESPRDDGIRALDGIAKALAALREVAEDIADTNADLETIADLLHDAAGDVAGYYQRRAEQPAWSHNDERPAA